VTLYDLETGTVCLSIPPSLSLFHSVPDARTLALVPLPPLPLSIALYIVCVCPLDFVVVSCHVCTSSCLDTYPCFSALHVYANLDVSLLVTSYPPPALSCLPVRIQTLPHQLPECRNENAGRVCALWLSPDASRLVVCTGERRTRAPSHITHPRNCAQMV
jgi:hypothetical protein